MASRYVYREVPHTDPDTRVFYAFAVGQPIGVIAIGVAWDEVAFLGVIPAHRRRGIARELLTVARQQSGLTLEYDGGERSADGAAFATAVGLKRGGVRQRMPVRAMEAKLNAFIAAYHG